MHNAVHEHWLAVVEVLVNWQVLPMGEAALDGGEACRGGKFSADDILGAVPFGGDARDAEVVALDVPQSDDLWM